MLTGITDLNRLIVSYLDDIDILEFCKTCKYANEKVCDENFFRNLISQRYKNTLKYKDYVKTRSYKQYFYSVIYYISKLKTKYNLNYLQEFENRNLEGSPELEYFARKHVPKCSKYSKEEGLIFASEIGHLPVVKYLVENNADIHSRDDCALRWASEGGHFPLVKYLVEHNANIHAQNDYALLWSSVASHFDVVEYLVKKGANVNIFNAKHLSMYIHKRNYPMVKLLLEHAPNIDNDDVLKSAIIKNDLALVKCLVEYGVNINYKNFDAAGWKVQKSGIDGDVRLLSLK